MAFKVHSIKARRALESLGGNVKTARLKRRISLEDFAERVGVSKRTIIRLEKGEDGVSVGTLAMACLVLGEIEQIASLLDVSSDDTGLMLDQQNLPKRIDGTRKKKPNSTSIENPPADADHDDDGVGF